MSVRERMESLLESPEDSEKASADKLWGTINELAGDIQLGKKYGRPRNPTRKAAYKDVVDHLLQAMKALQRLG